MDVSENLKLYQEAVDAWIKWCDENGVIRDQPSATLSEIDDEYVYLSNTNGLLATYDIKKKLIE